MKKTNTIKSLLVGIVLTVTAFGIVSAVPSANLAQAQSAAGSVEADINAPEVKSLAEDRRISKPEARKRITWQNKASQLDKQLRKDLPGDRFGGVWIDESTDRVKVGVVGGLTPTDIQKKNVEDKVSGNALNEATDVVGVTYSYAQLEEATAWITEKLSQLNQGVEWPLSVEINTNKNKVALTLPVSDLQLAKQQTAFMQQLQKRYGDMIVIARSSNKIVNQACNWNYCSDPLRGGIPLHANNFYNYGRTACTAGFIVRGSSGQKYILTAGHCKLAGNGWGTLSTSGSLKKIGPIKNSGLWRNNGYDAMTIDISNEYGWSANGWVFLRAGSGSWDGPTRNEEYDVSSTGTSGSLVGERICKSGAVFGASCGPVKAVEGTIPTAVKPGVTYNIKKVVRAAYCSRGGDSGAPVIRNHNALGIHIAAGGPLKSDGEPEDCGVYKYYAGIEPILSAFSSEYGQHYSIF